VKDAIEELWGRFRHLSEPPMKSSAKDFLYSVLWEMELWDALTQCGFSVSRAHLIGPDFIASRGNDPVFVEAVAPRRGDGPDKVEDLATLSNQGTDAPIAVRRTADNYILRYRSAIESKREQWLRASKIHSEITDLPFVVAINSCGIVHTFDNEWNRIPDIVKAVMSAGDLLFSIPRTEDEQAEVRYDRQVLVTKKSGANVRTDIFENPRYKMISGIIYTSQTLTRRSGAVKNNLLLVLNTNALHPIPQEWLGVGRVMWSESDNIYSRQFVQHELGI
jgi:hypothetical protein